MSEIIELSHSDLPAIESLLNLTFPVGLGKSYFDDFPFWKFAHFNKQILFGIKTQNKLSAVAMAKLGCFKIVDRIYSVSVIGSVATAPEARGQGYASQLVQALCQRLQSQKVSCAFLFGSAEEKLYQRLGFAGFGEQVRIPLLKLELKSGSKAQNWVLHRGYSQELGKTLIQRKSGLLLDDEDLNWISQHRNCQWISVTQKNSKQVLAYAVIGKGIDLPNMVHEWGTASPHDEAALHFLIAQIAKENSAYELLGSRQEILAHGFSSQEAWVESLGMVKSLSDQAPTQEQLDSIWLWGFDGV